MIYPSPKIEASYLYVDLGLEFAATIEVSDLVNVDVDAAGSVVGIERIGGPVDQETLLAVIAKIQQAAYQAGREDAAREIEEKTGTFGMDGLGRHLVACCVRFARGNQPPRTPLQGVGDNTEEQQQEGPGES